MKEKNTLLTLILLLMLGVLPVLAQPPQKEMREKYKLLEATEGKKPIDVYEVRPEILAVFYYRQDLHPYRIDLKHSTAKDAPNKTVEMPYPLVQEILDELVPNFYRGRFCGDFDFESGRNSYRTANYENLSIEMDLHNSTNDESKGTVGGVLIEFQLSMCSQKVS